MEGIQNSFFNQFSDDFFEYLQDYRTNKLKNIEEYRKLEKEICEIERINPNVMKYLEGEIEELSNSDLKALFKIIALQEEMSDIEQKEIFKLGCKEAYIFFLEMDLLKG